MSFQQNSQQNEPSSIEELLAKAMANHKVGQLGEAEQFYHEIIKRSPQQGEALYRLAMLYIQSGRAAQALPLLELVLKAQSQNPGVLNSYGVALQLSKRSSEAIDCFQKALMIRPGDVGTLGNLGRALREQNKVREALDCFLEILRLNPNNPNVQIEIGRCHYEMGSFNEAIRTFEDVLMLRPNYVEAISGKGIALSAIGHLDEARQMFEQALLLEPSDLKALINLGEFSYDEGKIDEALTYFDQALAIDPKDSVALWRKSFALLAKGEYSEGWKLYADSLGKHGGRGPNKFAPQPTWDGRPDKDKHLLIWCEQGFGDSIQFIRYAELCKQRMGKVSVFCQTSLISLFQSISFVDHVSDVCDRSDFDEHVPMMNLPHLFETTVEKIPASIPYLHANSERETKWTDKFVNNKNMKIGLVWACGSHQGLTIDKLSASQRSIPLKELKPWLDLKGTQFYSLQKDNFAQEIKQLELEDHLINYMNEVKDFADTAALVMNLDLVITVDTSVAHLAGALGKPVWIMSRYNADWRWLQNRPYNPWYPTARIFGQSRMNDWSGVIAKIQNELIHTIEVQNEG
jgi:tetratricopeptide (TPR) repeat protein